MTETSPISSILSAFQGKNVLILGDVMLDEHVFGTAQRISPEAPIPVVEIHNRTYAPGGAANVAANVVALGARASLGGMVGQDPAATELMEQLQQRNICADGIFADVDRPTTTKTRILAHNQQVVRLDVESRNFLNSQIEDLLLDWAKKSIATANVCILSDYGKGVVSPRIAMEFIRLAQEAKRPLVVDPKGTDYSKYIGATIIAPNIHEAARALKLEGDIDAGDVLKVGPLLLDLVSGSAVLITQGAQGMSLFTSDSQIAQIPAKALHVFDVTGAGDTVVSVLALALASNASLEQSVRIATRAAEIVVGKLGTAQVSLDELGKASFESEI